MQMVQVDFEKVMGGKIAHKVVWIDKSWNLSVGDRVSFKGAASGDGIWTVGKVYSQIIEMEKLDVRWGTGLPPSFRTER